MSTELRALPKPIKGAGLTNPGVVVLQFLLILLVETIEYSATKVGVITGVALIIALAGGIYLGRSGTIFTAVVNPPISFFISSVILIATIGGAGVHVAKFGLDLVQTLGGAAPYLVLGTALGWGWYFWSKHQENSEKKVVTQESSPSK